MAKIKLNKVVASFNYDVIREKYIVCRVFGDVKNVSFAAIFLDEVLQDYVYIESVLYLGGKSCYLLVNKKQDIYELCCVLSRKYPNLQMEEMELEVLTDYRLLQLLLNSLSQRKTEEYRFNNLTGTLIYIYPSLLKRNKSGEIIQIIASKFQMRKEMVLEESICSFTRVTPRDNVISDKTRRLFLFDKKTGMMKRCFDLKCREDVFIDKQFFDHTNRVDYMNFNAFDKCKGYAWCRLLDGVDKFLGNYLKLEFKEVECFQQEKLTRTRRNFKKNRVKEFVKERSFVIVDSVLSAQSKRLAVKLSDVIQDIYHGRVYQRRPMKDDICFYIVPVKDNCTKEEDTYRKAVALSQQGYVVQCFMENFGGDDLEFSIKKDGTNSILNNILKEVIIKDDLKKRKISLVDWNEFGFDGEWTFCIPNKEQLDTSLKMSIGKDGCFTFSSVTDDRISVTTLVDAVNKNANAELIIQSPDKQINIIENTHISGLLDFRSIEKHIKGLKTDVKIPIQDLLSAISDMSFAPYFKEKLLDIITGLNLIIADRTTCEMIIEDMSDSEKSLFSDFLLFKYDVALVANFRDKRHKEEIISSQLDISYWKLNTRESVYLAGQKSQELNTKFVNSTVARRVFTYGSHRLFFDELLPLMAVDFVKHEELTVFPFPIKYLREYSNEN